MNNSVLILGESGTGKSTSIRNLPPEQTFIINVINKPLPFKGAAKKYKKIGSGAMIGNYYENDDPVHIRKLINHIDSKRPDIKYLIIDDFGYTMSNSFMRKAHQKGYDKFTDIGKDTFEIIEASTRLRHDLFCFVMMHTEIDQQGRYKPKTVGKMVDQYINIEGRFMYVLHALVTDGQYKFLTNNDGQHMAKTPLGLFEHLFIDNDLAIVVNAIDEYNGVDEEGKEIDHLIPEEENNEHN